MADFTPDVTRGYHGGNQESNDAHRSIVKDKAAIRGRVVNWIRARGAKGATSDECEVASGMTHQTISARFTEAKALGLIVATGEKRKTRSGRNAAVFVAAGTLPTQETGPTS